MKVRTAQLIICFLAVVTAGCDFLSSSGPEGGVDPFLTDLDISDTAVFCDDDFATSFRYSDPQNDIEFIRVTLQHTDQGTTLLLEVLFEGGESEEGTLNLDEPGMAAFTTSFPCGVDLPTGSYVVSVQLVDARAHDGNTRSGSIRLISS